MVNLTSGSASSLVHPLHFMNQKGKIKKTIKNYMLDFIQIFIEDFFFTFYMYGCFTCIHVCALEYLVLFKAKDGVRALTTELTSLQTLEKGS